MEKSWDIFITLDKNNTIICAHNFETDAIEFVHNLNVFVGNGTTYRNVKTKLHMKTRRISDDSK